MLKEIAQYIENKTSLAIGTDLFVGHRTEASPDNCTVLLESGISGVVFDIPDRVDFALQVLTRADTYFTAEKVAVEVYDILKANEGITLPIVGTDTIYVYVMEARDYPKFIGQTERGLFEFSTNYELKIKKN